MLINGFVGALVGIERSILPNLAETESGLTSKSAAVSFLISFGTVKAFGNLFTGRLADRFGRKRILIVGWLSGLPVPLLVIYAAILLLSAGVFMAFTVETQGRDK